MGSLFNANFYLTKGLQMAGLFNYSGKTENAVQFAGVFNTSIDGNAVAQFGCVFNVAKESTTQFAGVANITAGDTGVQLASVLNIAKESTVQLGGVVNISIGAAGTQWSGVVNYSGGSTSQLSVLNISMGATGTQLGVLNIAKEVNGLQLGVINYAEDMNGLPIGLISVVKNGGKREFEVGFSEGLNTFASFKFGVNKFYTIISGGIDFIDNPIIYGFGLGFGTHIDWFDGWGNQVELMSYQLYRGKKWIIDDDIDMNMLAQLKFRVSKQFNGYFKVFLGPTFNLTILRLANSNADDITTLSPWSLWKNDSKKTKLNSWIGVEGGVSIGL
jgi:hypothetical protein